MSSQNLHHSWKPTGMPITCFANRTRIWRIWVALIFTEVLGNVVTSQLCHNVWDVTERTQMLQAFMSSPCQRMKSMCFSAIQFI